MVTRVEPDQSDQAAPVTKESRLRRYLARRGRQLRRVLLFFAVALALAAGARDLPWGEHDRPARHR